LSQVEGAQEVMKRTEEKIYELEHYKNS